MNNTFVNSFIVSVLYLVIKFIQMRFIEKKNKPIKELVSDTLMVYISVLFGFYMLQLIEKSEITEQTHIFTGSPDF